MNDTQTVETVEDVRQACIEMARLSERLGGTWRLDATRSKTHTIYVVEVRVPLAKPEPAVQQMALAGTE